APLYFPYAATTNRRDRERFEPDQDIPVLTATQALAHADDGAVLVDTRSAESFASGHLTGSVNVSLDGRYAEYAGNVIRAGQPVVLLGSPGRGPEARTRLARIGFDEVVGVVDDVETALVERPELAQAARRLVATEVAQWLGHD